MVESETEYINPWLGHRPFVLVELDGEITGPGEEDYTIEMIIKFGGGIGTSGAMGVLSTVLEGQGWTVVPPEGFDPDVDD